jgi:hypothetical protein
LFPIFNHEDQGLGVKRAKNPVEMTEYMNICDEEIQGYARQNPHLPAEVTLKVVVDLEQSGEKA